jgi:hypothetical protein
MSDKPESLFDEEREALDRIARTRDGLLFHRFLRRVLEQCSGLVDPRALQIREGARILARDLMGHMARGIEGSIGRTDDTPLLNRGSSGNPARRRAGSRRVSPDPVVEAFLREHGSDPA